MLFTWESVYAARDTNAPISFQTELFANGDFTYRYDFSLLTNVYTRSYTNGLPTLTTRTIKAASSAAEFSDTANAISTTTHYSGAEDYDALPELMPQRVLPAPLAPAPLTLSTSTMPSAP